jgi:hypothetical protein
LILTPSKTEKDLSQVGVVYTIAEPHFK